MQIIRGTNFKHFVWWWSWFIANLFLCVVFWEGLLRTKEMPDCWISSLRGLPNVDFVRFQCITWQTAGHSSSTQWHPVWSSNLNHILKIILLFYGYWLRSCFPQCLFKKEKTVWAKSQDNVSLVHFSSPAQCELMTAINL